MERLIKEVKVKEIVVRLYQEEGIEAVIKRLVKPKKKICVPLESIPGVFEPSPLFLKWGQRVEVFYLGRSIFNRAHTIQSGS